MLHRVNRIVCHLEDAAMSLVALAIFLVMIIKFVDVVLRYAINAPLQWSYGFISHYLLVSAFFLALPYTFRVGRHVRVDAFINRLRPGPRRAMRVVDFAVSLSLFALILYQGVVLVSDAWSGGEIMPDFYNWPGWTSKIFVPVGVGLLEVRLLLNTLAAFTAEGAETPPFMVGSGTAREAHATEALVEPSHAEFM
jgi:TRAP-type C4-dicarboxylate transport system permease small subunit